MGRDVILWNKLERVSDKRQVKKAAKSDSGTAVGELGEGKCTMLLYLRRARR